MNKSYFTKLIPVEGEIKEGDWFQVLGKPLPIGTLTLRYTEEFDKGTPNMQKVKLFLCSLNFEVGDTVYNKYYTDYANGKVINTNSEVMDAGMLSGGEPDSTTDYKYPEGEWEYHHQTYKIIGEVSPNAIWVKEGMEFDEKEVEIYGVYSEPRYVKAHIATIHPNNPVDKWIVEFKCPTCSTFH